MSGSADLSVKTQLVYDGVCNLCISVVRFLYALYGERLVQYVPYQDLSASFRREYELTDEALQGRMYLIRRDGSLIGGPFALTEVCRLLTPFSFMCDLFKTPLAQQVYNWTARRRYSLFGCRDSCYAPRHNR